MKTKFITSILLALLVQVSCACSHVSKISMLSAEKVDFIELTEAKIDGFLLFERFSDFRKQSQRRYRYLFIWGEEALELESKLKPEEPREGICFEVLYVDEKQALHLSLLMSDIFNSEELEPLGSLSTNPSFWRIFWFDTRFSEEVMSFHEHSLFDAPVYRPELSEGLVQGDFESERMSRNLKYLHLLRMIEDITNRQSYEGWRSLMFK